MNYFMTKDVVLITGASQGIGKHLALECAKRKQNLLLIALASTGLEQLAIQISTDYNVTVFVLEIDLTHHEAVATIYNYCKINQLVVTTLINNAGIGYEGRFGELNLAFCEKLVLLNIQALVSLTHIFLDDMLQLQQAHILNVSSMASFSPMPYKCLYAASKSFVYSFTRALRTEYKGSKINICVLCPGPVATNLVTIQNILNHGIVARLSCVEPDQLARLAINKLYGKQEIIIPGFINKLNRLILKFTPMRLKQAILANEYK
jgi:uncharacterized protein